MKYIVLLGDGMADEPLDILNGKTPLEYAATPVMDELAGKGELGMVRTVPAGMKPGEVYLYGPGGNSVYLRGNGNVEIWGSLFINGVPYKPCTCGEGDL